MNARTAENKQDDRICESRVRPVDSGIEWGDILPIESELAGGGGEWSRAIAKEAWMNVLLVRAAPSDWDVAGRVGASAELPLSEVHEAEVRESLGALEGTELRTILTAPDACSRAVGSIVAELTGTKAREVEGLSEVDMGLWEGLRLTDVADRHPKAAKQWGQDMSTVSPPNGETTDEAAQRLLGALKKATAKLSSCEPGVALVLRPVAFSALRSFVTGVPAGFSAGDQGTCVHQWIELPAATLEGERPRVGA